VVRRYSCSMGRKVLVIVVRADPIICGHSTEARNLAEAALVAGYEPYIITWHDSLLGGSGLPLKPAHEIAPYSPGITVLRPDAIGNYKLLDGRFNLGMTAAIVEIARQDPTMEMTLMCLYLQPHAKIVLDAVDAIRGAWGESFNVTTIAEAVGSDVTNVLSNAMREQNFGAAITVLTQFLAFDVPVCVSQFTLDEVLRHASDVDEVLGTNFAARLQQKCALSYPALNVTEYTELDPERAAEVLSNRGLVAKKYVLYLSRVIEAKGIFELVAAYRSSNLPAAGIQLLIVGRGEALESVQAVTAGDSNIRHMTDMADAEKAAIFDGAASYVLPSKFHPTFVETFGIVITEAMLTHCGPVITCRTGGIPEAAGEDCIYAEVDNSDETGAHQPCLEASLKECLNKVVLEMSAEEKEQMTAKAREYSMQFGREHVFALLESKATVAREQKRVATAPNSPPSSPDNSPTKKATASSAVDKSMMELGSLPHCAPALTSAEQIS
jgi:glycogen(starch) synthase